MKKLPVILTSAALCSVAAFATMPTAYAAEDGTPEKAVEIAKSYLNNELSFTDTKGAWCVKFALNFNNGQLNDVYEFRSVYNKQKGAYERR